MKIKKQNKAKRIITAFSFLILGLLPHRIFAQWSVDNLKQFNLPDSPRGIAGIVGGVASWLLGILSLVSLIAFMVAGIWYLTAAGDESQIERAKRAMLYSIVGVIVGLSGFVIVKAISAMLSGKSFF